MSQQYPPQQPPYGPPGQPGQPGQPGMYPQQPYTQPPQKKHTLRNVFLVLALLFVLVVAGCVALIGTAANEANKSLEADKTEVGGRENPLTIQPGEAFEVRGLNYKAGWKIGNDALGTMDVKGLKVTNNRDKTDEAIVEIKAWKGTEVVALADCTTEQIAVGTTTTLSCVSGDKLPKGYDKITIQDTF